MAKFFFFDDQYLNAYQGIKRVAHSPKPLLGATYQDPASELVHMTWAYPLVYYHPTLQKYICLYQGWSHNRSIIPNALALAAQSDDGLHFEPLDLTHLGLNKPILNNQILPLQLEDYVFNEGQFFHLPTLKETPFIALTIYKGPKGDFKAVTYSSTDGIQFKVNPTMAWHQGEDAPDFPLSIVYDTVHNDYLIYRRPRHTDRRIAVSRTKDFLHYQAPKVILQADALDEPLTDCYGLFGFTHDSFKLGLLMLYHTPNYLQMKGYRTSGLPGHKFDGGTVENQLVYSKDGIIFRRFLRTPFLTIDQGKCHYPTSMLKTSLGLRFYASTSLEEHGRYGHKTATIQAFDLRYDGFCSMNARAGWGELITKPFLYEGGDITWNIQALYGIVKLQICDADNQAIPGFTYEDCVPFTGDSIKHLFVFRKASMNTLKGKVITFNLLFTSAEIYTLEGNLKWMTPFEILQIKKA